MPPANGTVSDDDTSPLQRDGLRASESVEWSVASGKSTNSLKDDGSLDGSFDTHSAPEDSVGQDDIYPERDTLHYEPIERPASCPPRAMVDGTCID